MLQITTEIKRQFNEIIEKELIYPVYQPIISLKDGELIGYEALSRISLKTPPFNVEEMFQLSEQLGKVWELEEICRIKSIENAKKKPKGTKLYLNVNPNVLKDKQFHEGMTASYLKTQGFKNKDIVFEITERTSIDDSELFSKTIEHYKKQDFKIAIDDFGDGYASLNRICALRPKFIKLDIQMIHDIDKDHLKQSLIESCAIFCKNSGIKLIAEGIETADELKELIRLGVDYGQGYYIRYPAKNMEDISPELKQNIQKWNYKHILASDKPSFWNGIGTIATQTAPVQIDDSALHLYESFQENEDMSEICAIDSEYQVRGLVTREQIYRTFGGRYGFTLHSRSTIEKIIDDDTLIVDYETPIELVSRMALARPKPTLYDAIVVTRNQKYEGIVTVKDLLETALTIQVSKAMDASPLTGLPGNSVIQEKIAELIGSTKEYAVVYFDLDNFKAYNDAYGFQNGDRMIKILAESITEAAKHNEFIGHIGGDDIVMISKHRNVEETCMEITTKFSTRIKELYNTTDWNRGYILSTNRYGFPEQFPIATVSIAAITDKSNSHESLESFSEKIAKLKKKAKKQEGNSFICD